MIIAIIILGVLLAAATAIIFWLWKVLKNTCDITFSLIDTIENKQPRSLRKAYNDKYYPATLIAQVKFDADWEGTITDFSMYETQKIVGFTVMTKESAQEYYGADLYDEMAEIGEEALAQLTEPIIMKNKLVYEVSEGVWAWKSAE
jgi:hypothetical protein